ncbi:hypothetical protein QFZ75_001755 [Streptomyces sp. V3I8]|uniref:hypothetical protein n=1 Tax=Streptomyces sp. V3I8 TaxID=3042279 RepID=UPI002785583F|nr:hypothetical protein [Streptomyces sp. V3I8]MDQ1035339.1 hypothetical protein [Streptomyces sp. V3I8]
MTAAVTLPAAPPTPGASEEERAAFLRSLIEPGFFAEVGWDAERRVLSAPVGHPLLGMRACPVPECDLPSKSRGLCRTCQDQHRKSGLPLEEFVKLPRTTPGVGGDELNAARATNRELVAQLNRDPTRQR